MQRSVVERRLRDCHARLVRAREELAVLEEQLVHFHETADEARIRSLVAETPLADREWHEARRHFEAMERASQATRKLVAELERTQDELLDQLVL